MMVNFCVFRDTSMKILLSVHWTISLNTTFLFALYDAACKICCPLARHHAVTILDVVHRIETACKLESKLEFGPVTVVKPF